MNTQPWKTYKSPLSETSDDTGENQEVNLSRGKTLARDDELNRESEGLHVEHSPAWPATCV